MVIGYWLLMMVGYAVANPAISGNKGIVELVICHWLLMMVGYAVANPPYDFGVFYFG
ncbi:MULTISPECIES: hypothetical protein [unclassified Nodularia (in: cyanobacteria)]|uniref:hypothetical protein n=1 Tax=unclassified Nodularia (in: cyanobacteria) TaxID=2656917 RepID=UPI0018810C0A|nr:MULTISPECIES: hypothetical protein [unclassified Nodularia (in: cyanobacteria)]MBE9197924.1 hypothetical protein [Nodularia sp. LEGE 06071]MCC2693541.1 hypothetical protein [Nodularia sp. LEGE 04288]